MVTLTQAQDDGPKLAKQAGRALTSYNINPSDNADKLEEAKSKIDRAIEVAEVQEDASAWITRGEIYNTIIQREAARMMIDTSAHFSGDNDALVAFRSFQQGYNRAKKDYQRADAVKGAGEVQGHLINIGVTKYERGEYEKAFQSFEAALQCHDMLKAQDKKSLLDEPAQLDNQVYITALAAQLAERNAEAEKYYQQLYRAGTDKPAVYEGLYNLKVATGDQAAADKILAEGRAKFPKDPGLLFAEINIYLKKGKLEDLISRLRQAIEQEPTNESLYVTLGSVYDNLYQREVEAKNTAKANEYFEAAKTEYNRALKINPKNADAIYSIGALYYNKAAARTLELNALPQDDFSAAAMKKYETMRDEIMALFDQALPYFQKAEALNPNDLNTLIALSEIYARKDDTEKTTELKKRMETVKNNGKNSSSFFKQ